jgi:hypothetical protein
MPSLVSTSSPAWIRGRGAVPSRPQSACGEKLQANRPPPAPADPPSAHARIRSRDRASDLVSLLAPILAAAFASPSTEVWALIRAFFADLGLRYITAAGNTAADRRYEQPREGTALDAIE